MTFEQLHFAFGASIPFIAALIFYDRKFIFVAPFFMTLTGVMAILPFYLGWHGIWTNIFFLYGVINSLFSHGQFYGYGMIIGMYTVVLVLQALFLWRKEKNA